MENTDRFSAIVESKRGRIIQRNVLERKTRFAFANEREGVLDHRQRFEPKEIHFEQPEIVERIHRVLAHDVVALHIAAERDVVG